MFLYGSIFGAAIALLWFHYYGVAFVAALRSYYAALQLAYAPATKAQGFVLLPAIGALSGLIGILQGVSATATATVTGGYNLAVAALGLLGEFIKALSNPLVAFIFGGFLAGVTGLWVGVAHGEANLAVKVEDARKVAITKANTAVDIAIAKANENAAKAIANAKAEYELKLCTALKNCKKK